MLPALLGLAITVFKDTSVLVVVAAGELTYTSRQVQTAAPVNYAMVLGIVIVIYWSIAAFGSIVVSRIEKRLARGLFI